jgi:adenosine deaminase
MSQCNVSFKELLPTLLLALFMFQGCASLELTTGKHTEQVSSASGVAASSICFKNNSAVKKYFDVISSVKKERPDIVVALTKFPKGADLHNHLSGTVMPDDYISLGSMAGYCFGPDQSVKSMYTIVKPPDCVTKDFKPLAQASDEERQKLLRSLSMYQFNDNGFTSIQGGHDHFFATFGRFGAISGLPDNMGTMLAKLLQQANADNVSYVETMISFQSKEVGRLAELLRNKFPDNYNYTQCGKYDDMYKYLLDEGLEKAVVAAQSDIASYVEDVNDRLKCDTAAKDHACEVSFAFHAAVNRNSSLQGKGEAADLPKIFTQTALSFLLADRERRVVGVNLVSGEDLLVSMQSFDTQMQLFSCFHHRFPQVNIALHGGELTPCFVGGNKTALKEHLTASIQAGAKRLGHAVSFAYLDDADKAEVVGVMKENKTLVEIPFTSNAQILGVTGQDHPFPQYFRVFGVPAAFSTDDEGVSYSDFTSEWIYAVRQYNLTYDELVQLARLSLQHSFLPGEPLWQDVAAKKAGSQCAGEVLGGRNYGEPCRTFLNFSPKARTQWDYEAKRSQFEEEHGTILRKYLGEKLIPGEYGDFFHKQETAGKPKPQDITNLQSRCL